MRQTGLLVTVAILAFGGLNSAVAQTLSDSDTPAEFPPASYSGKQYVDSRGCVFIRAGFDGSVVWVPRVSRDRKMLCGFAPTLAAGTTPKPVVQAPTPVAAKSKPLVAPIAVSAPAARRVVAAPVQPAPAVLSTKSFGLPKGFKAAWTDGRLNPDRGPKTEAATANMDLIWTKTVPRRLIQNP